MSSTHERRFDSNLVLANNEWQGRGGVNDFVSTFRVLDVLICRWHSMSFRRFPRREVRADNRHDDCERAEGESGSPDFSLRRFFAGLHVAILELRLSLVPPTSSLCRYANIQTKRPMIMPQTVWARPGGAYLISDMSVGATR